MYRAVGVLAAEGGTALDDVDALGRLADGLDFELTDGGQGMRVDGRDVPRGRRPRRGGWHRARRRGRARPPGGRAGLRADRRRPGYAGRRARCTARSASSPRRVAPRSTTRTRSAAWRTGWTSS